MTYLIVPKKIRTGIQNFSQFQYGRHRNYIFQLIITFLQRKSVLQVILMWTTLVKIICRWNNIIKTDIAVSNWVSERLQ